MVGSFGRKPVEIKASLDKTGLHCGSVHNFGLGPATEAMDTPRPSARSNIITSVVLPKRLTEAGAKLDWNSFAAMLKTLNRDDYKVDRRAVQSHRRARPKKQGCSSGTTTTM